jgi:hypothetical protein
MSTIAPRAWAQACCAGSAAITPARLSVHEDALVGVTLRAATVLGSYDPTGHYTASPAGSSEIDREEDLLAAVRVFERGQLALLVPFVETTRHVSAPDTTELGGGIGDINFSGRYDFYLAGQSRFVPGVALLLGVTFPTGTSVESASKPLATDATGIGAFQGNIGLALEQTYGPWLLNVTGLVAKRAAHSIQTIDETLATQFTGLLATAYTFDNGVAAGAVASYAVEGDATIATPSQPGGTTAPMSGKRVLQLSLAGLWPLTDAWRLSGSLYLNPPASSLGAGQPATGGLTLTLLRTWS